MADNNPDPITQAVQSFATMPPDQQKAMLDYALQGVGGQQRAVGRNPVNESRMREHLAGNDAYVQQLSQRMNGQPNSDSVYTHMRDNDAFMLQGDDLTPAPPRRPAASAGGARRSAATQEPNLAQEEAQSSGLRDKGEPQVNLAQEQAQQSGHRDRMAPDAQPSPQQAPSPQVSQEDDKGSGLFPWLLAAFGARPAAKAAAGRGGLPVPTAQTSNVPAQQSRGDGIVDAEWSDAKDIEGPRKQLPAPAPQVEAPRKQLGAPAEQEQSTAQKTLDKTMDDDATEEKSAKPEKETPKAKQAAPKAKKSAPLDPDSQYKMIQDTVRKAMSAGPSARRPRAPKPRG